MTTPRFEIGVVDVDGVADDEVDLGGPRRPPGRAVLVAGAVTVLAVGGIVAVTHRGAGTVTARPAPAVATSAAPASHPNGPTLVEVDGQAALSVPVGPATDGLQTTDVRVLAPAPDAVAAVAAALPGWRGAEAMSGGRVVGPWSRYGVYLTGSLVGSSTAKTVLTIYTMRAPGTTYGTDHLTTENVFDQGYTLRTEVTVFTGTGWWVHVLAVGTYGSAPDDVVPALTALAGDTRLTS